MKQITVKVPATSANLGAGFDSLGLALNIYNTFEIEECDHIDIQSLDEIAVPKNEQNLVYKTVKSVYDLCGVPLSGLRLRQLNPIPMARGLGSSSTCIVAGIAGANKLLGDPLSLDAMLHLAAKYEGHPDNVMPAFLGGFVTSVLEEEKVFYVKQPVEEELLFAAFVPNFELLTSKARAALPKEVLYKDAVFNLSRAGLAAAAFCTKQYQLLSVACDDKLHQQYRLPLIEGGKEIFALAKECGAQTVFISGAGPTIMAVVCNKQKEFLQAAKSGLEANSALADFHLVALSADNNGVQIF